MFKINDIIEFFGRVSDSTEMYVTKVEVKPVMIKGDLYITGFKRHGLGVIEAHIKEMKEINIPSVNKSLLTLHGTPSNDLWVPVEILAENTLEMAFNEIKKRFFNLKSYDVAILKYRLKTASKSDYITMEEVGVYEDKTQAYRDAIQKRRLCETFKSDFKHFGEASETKKITDLEFAESAL